MQEYFYELSAHLDSLPRGGEVYLASYSAEDSDFVRFNHGLVRQAMHVTQQYMSVELIDGARHISADITLTGDRVLDCTRLSATVGALRERLGFVPDDPYLLYSTRPKSTERVSENLLPSPTEAVDEVLRAGQGLDLVGLFASGGIFHGFANSLGQRNWFATYSHNMDWSLYHAGDKAVKASYADFSWDASSFEQKMLGAREQLGHLRNTPRTIDPGRYRVYLSPVAMQEIVEMMTWGGFGMKDHRTKQTPLIRMVEEGARLREDVSLAENTGGGVAANFQSEGFIKPPKVSLIEAGMFSTCLTSPRSAREYGVATNAATEEERPESLDMAPGTIPREDMLTELGTGLYVNNLNYLNFSDRSACRLTGITRFATFWVEKGRIVAPVNVMRFDESIYRILGDRLIGLTRERDFLLDALTYGGRSTASMHLPGVLVEDLTFTM